MSVPTPHIEAARGDIAKTVLMPGDPLRAKFVAETYLEDARLYNGVRGMLGYTGTYKGKRLSVQGSGMGMPSIGIYSYELYHFYGVESIIRIGSAGALQEKVQIGDLVIGQGACTNSAFEESFSLPGRFAPIAGFALLEKAVAQARKQALPFHVGNLLSSDVFYEQRENNTQAWASMGVLAVEMEAAALYMNAAHAGKQALCICTVSDSLITGESTSAQHRQTALTQMMELALEIAE